MADARHAVPEATFATHLRAALRRGLPVAVLLALGVGLAVAVGANLSNAFPSHDKPYGWPGAAVLEGGVAMVRPELVLAATLPALLLGVRTRPVVRNGRNDLLPGVAAGSALIALALLAATLIGAGAAAQSPAASYYAFWAAHTLLALSAFALGAAATALAGRRHGAVAALGAWTAFAVLLDDTIQWQVFRQEGYDNLAAGMLPSWFYVAQVLSPVSAYRAVLILWRPGFRNYLEHAALDKAALPAWLTPGAAATAMLLLWVALPLAVAAFAWRWRRVPATHVEPLPSVHASANAVQEELDE